MESIRHFGGHQSRYKSTNFYPSTFYSDPFEENEVKTAQLKSTNTGKLNSEELIPIENLLEEEVITQPDSVSRHYAYNTDTNRKQTYVSIRKITSTTSSFVINQPNNDMLVHPSEYRKRQQSLNYAAIMESCNQNFEDISLVTRGDLILEQKVTIRL